MAGTWGKWHGSWERPGATAVPVETSSHDADSDEALSDEEEGDPAEWATWFVERDFTLIRDSDHASDDRGTAALALDIDDRPVVPAFTSLKHANVFAGEQPELFDDPQDIQGFVVEGRVVMETTPPGVGILIDPASDEERYLSPELVERIRKAMER